MTQTDMGRMVVKLILEHALALGYPYLVSTWHIGKEELEEYAKKRVEYLASISEDAGYIHAVEAEACNVLSRMALSEVWIIDARDRKLTAVVKGILSLAARIVLV